MGVQAVTFDELHHQVDRRLRVYRFIQLADVLMVQSRLYPDLSDCLLASLKVSQF